MKKLANYSVNLFPSPGAFQTFGQVRQCKIFSQLCKQAPRFPIWSLVRDAWLKPINELTRFIEILGWFVRNRNIEHFLDSHHQFNRVEAFDSLE